MKVSKSNETGNTTINLSNDELIDALETQFANIYENISDNCRIVDIINKHGAIEIVIEN
jgi:hypothetical protein